MDKSNHNERSINYWTAVVKSATAVPLLVIGVIMAINPHKQNYLLLSTLGLVLSGVVNSLPTFAISTCTAPGHICNTVMKPAISGLGPTVVPGSATGIAGSSKKADHYEFSRPGR